MRNELNKFYDKSNDMADAFAYAAISMATLKQAISNNIAEIIEKEKQDRLNKKWAAIFYAVVAIDTLLLLI